MDVSELAGNKQKKTPSNQIVLFIVENADMKMEQLKPGGGFDPGPPVEGKLQLELQQHTGDMEITLHSALTSISTSPL